MGFRKIDVDDEVFETLQDRAVPLVDTPNDVLRRILSLGEPTERPADRPGDLSALLDAGQLIAGDQLEHHQPRKRRTFTAEVTSDGYIQLPDGQRFRAPSPALKACVGNDVNGWDHWKVVRVGRTLSELRGK